jgi:hypothetical protein
LQMQLILSAGTAILAMPSAKLLEMTPIIYTSPTTRDIMVSTAEHIGKKPG